MLLNLLMFKKYVAKALPSTNCIIAKMIKILSFKAMSQDVKFLESGKAILLLRDVNVVSTNAAVILLS